MRKFLSLSILWLWIFQGLSFGQVPPDGIQFQAVARDLSGVPLANTAVTVRFNVQNGGGTTVYSETHALTTDQFGLFDVVLGDGTPTLGTFANIGWEASQHQVQIDLDAGAGFVNLGTCQFQSVPYAFVADRADMDLGELVDVDLTGLAPGQTIVWNGTDWVPGNGSGIWSQNGTTAYYNTGRVGIGIDTPKTTLHLPDTANVLFGENLTGSGFKFIYYAAKGALRFGYLTNPFGGYNYNRFWDYDSVGFYSFAGGQNSRAKGFGAFAWGSFGWADGSGSVAFFGNARGNNSFTFGGSSRGRGSITFEGTAEDEGGIAMYGYTGGRYGVSIGGGTTGLGASSSREDYAVAIGWNSDARGQASIALGPSDAYGYNSFSTGWVTEARGNYSSTFGYQTNSYPYASMALGRYNVITGDSASWNNNDPIFMIGDGTSNTNRSNSFTILKNGRTAVGYNTPVGMLNVSSALGSIANGASVDATNSAILIGNATTGMAFDANQIETLNSSFYLNNNSAEDVILANGGGSVGVGTNAPSTRLDVENTGWQLSLNNPGVGGTDWYVGSSQNSWAAGGGKFVISPNNGSGNAAFAIINANSRVGIGNLNPSDRLHVSAAAGEDAFRVQVGGTTRLRVHDNGGVSIGVNAGPPAGGLRVNGITHPSIDGIYTLGTSAFRWSTVYAVNGIINTSDARLKTNIAPLSYGLDAVRRLNPVEYEWKSGSEKKIGFLAQDLEKTIPEAVYHPENPEGYLGVNYSDLIPVLVNALQEQDGVIQKQQDRLDQQAKKIEKLEKIVDALQRKIQK